MEPLTFAGVIIVIGLLWPRQAASSPTARVGPGGTLIEIPGFIRYINVPGGGSEITLLSPKESAPALLGPGVADWPADVPTPSWGGSGAVAGYPGYITIGDCSKGPC